jgi:hypothetical protein
MLSAKGDVLSLSAFHGLERQLNGAHKPFWAEVTINFGFGQTMVNQVAAETVGFWWADPWSTALGPDESKALSAISSDCFPDYGDVSSRST